MNVKIGEVLVSQGLVSPDQVNKALEYQKRQGGKLGSIMVELGFVSDTDLALALSNQLHIPAARIEDFKAIAQSALDCMDAETVQKHGCVPLVQRERLRVAISDPWTIKPLNEWAVQHGTKVQLVIAPEIWITAAMERYYKISRADRFKGAPQESIPLAEDELEVIDLEEEVSTAEFSFTSFQQSLSNCRSIEEVFDTFLSNLAPLLPQIAVYVARKGFFSGWVLQGFPARPVEFAKIQIDANLNTPLRVLAKSKKPYHGLVTSAVANTLGFDLLKLELGQELHFYPIVFRDQVSTALMGASERPLSELEDAQIRQACQKVEAALEMLVYRRIILAPSTA